ncbi:hypothetical protein M407DRAFT_109185 [Tulasnella calospora MUT 4182]|uniref:Uncharacterized protein n=1 Tax=Tulasnella calospora MUT 4182 TaxID=1051891 RepID=A0A0C3QD64_9AGAM|nr:hypothetical protein M407DRAFT_109185 [Tulasnella calospora MUT 4182]
MLSGTLGNSQSWAFLVRSLVPPVPSPFVNLQIKRDLKYLRCEYGRDVPGYPSPTSRTTSTAAPSLVC